MIRPLAFDAFRMAHHVVPYQTFWRLAKGVRRAGQNLTPGLERLKRCFDRVSPL
jgi:hypothetical protein